MNFDKESKSETYFGDMCVEDREVGGQGALKQKQYVRLPNEVKLQNSNHLHNVEYVTQSTFEKC